MSDLQSFCHFVIKTKGSDAGLSLLCYRTAGYARAYLSARKIRGCDGLGALDSLLDEFRGILYEMIRYCRKKEYIDPAIYNITVTDEELAKFSIQLMSLVEDSWKAMKKNCWEVKACKKCTTILGDDCCPVCKEVKLDGVHDGVNGGRACWTIPRTKCGGSTQRVFGNKFDNCTACNFYNMVKEEEKGSFYLSATPV